MRPYDLFASTLHYMIPSIKVDLRKYLLGYDDIYHVHGIAHICYDYTYFPHARPMLNETCHSHVSLELNDSYHVHASIELTDFYHSKHVLYSYAYVIGYSIDDLEGIYPITCSCCLCESYFRFLLMHESIHADQVRGDIPWDPGGVRAWR
ncbi:hypothetical protein VPH35_053108 [Triticum aestivum]